MQIALVDTFVVPESSREEFLKNVRFSAEHIRTIPGFVEGNVFERVGGEGRFSVVTTAVWKDRAAFEAARQAVGAMFQRIGFNPPEVMQKLGVQLDRSVYERTSY